MGEKKYTLLLAVEQFGKTSEEEARKRFFAYKDKKIIKRGIFDDNTWHMTDEYANYNLDFSFDGDQYKDCLDYLGTNADSFSIWVKTYVLTHMEYLQLTSLQGMINSIRKIMSCPIERLEKLSDEQNINYMNQVSDFFSLLPTEGRENELTDVLDRLDILADRQDAGANGGQRSLAAFESYFRFNDILKEYWSEEKKEDNKLFFFPVWLWWHLSAVIPMRPREFVLTPRRCLEEIDGQYFITIRKNKIKGSGKLKAHKISEDYVTVRYEIPETLATEIKWYLDKTKDYLDTEIGTLFLTTPHYSKWQRMSPSNSRFFTYINLTTCLRYFFDEIIRKRYGYTVILENDGQKLSDDKEIQYIHLGDSRHIALINIISEGATPMVAMMLAGHDNPEMSSHYYSNISTLIECRTYRQFKKQIKGKQSYSLSGPSGAIKTKEFTLLEDNGRCYSERARNNDFSDCKKACGPSGEMGLCKSCTFYRNESNEFKDSSELYRGRIMNECRNLQDIVKKVRQGKGEPEEIIQVLLRLRDEDYSYSQYLMETGGEKNAEE